MTKSGLKSSSKKKKKDRVQRQRVVRQTKHAALLRLNVDITQLCSSQNVTGFPKTENFDASKARGEEKEKRIEMHSFC